MQRTYPAVWAHRGDTTSGAVENTVEAFAAARTAGADGVELDVRRTADGALVVSHDAALPGLAPIATLAVRDLPPWVPLLDAALDACSGMTVNVEIKNSPSDPVGWDPSGAIAAHVVESIADRPDIVVSAFHLATLDVARSAGASATGWLLVGGADVAASAILAADRGHTAVHPYVVGLTADDVAAAHDVGVAVNAWTVNEPGDLANMGAWGVDVVMTDVPGLARSLYGAGVGG